MFFLKSWIGNLPGRKWAARLERGWEGKKERRKKGKSSQPSEYLENE